MKRNRFARLAAALLAAVLTLTGVASAQTTLTSTTLAAAITNASDQVMTITSATGWTATSSSAQAYAVIDREVVGVRSLSSTQVGITRGLFSTRATGHASGVVVYYIPAGSMALTNFDRAGACSTAGSADPTQSGNNVPVLNVTTGRTFFCQGSVWVEGWTLGANKCSVTQATNRTTGVTCTGISGTITTNNASLAAEGTAKFTVTNTAVAVGDAVIVSQRSGSNGGGTIVDVTTVAAGSFEIAVQNGNVAAGTAETGAIILNFVVVKAVP